MATKAKESTIVGKEKKAPSPNSHITSTKRTTKPSTAATTSSITKANTSPSEKRIPNYLKPTISSSHDQPKSDATKKTPPNRRRSFDKPLSSLNSTKQNHPSLSTLHKALVSPGPRERSIPTLRSSNVALKSNNLSIPISDRTSKTPSNVKTRTLFAKSAKKSTPSLFPTSTSNKKKVANDHHDSADSTNASKSTTEASNIETEEVKEVTNQEVEVIKVENEEEHEIEHSPHVHTECELERGHVLEESDLHHNQADNEKIISTVSEKEPQGEKAEDEHKEEENTNQGEKKSNESKIEEHSAAEDEHKEEENTNQGESKSNESQIEEHSAAEEEVAINEKEEQEGENKNEDEAMEKKEEVEEVKAEPTSSKQQLTTGGKGKKESQVSNDVIEETASKLLEERKNKVRALAGAFQTVIDYQTPSKWEQE